MNKISEKMNGQEMSMIKDKGNVADSFTEKAMWYIKKFANEADYIAGKHYEITPVFGNGLLNEGINELLTLACSSSGTKFDTTNAYLGVGDSATAFDAAQTGLQAVTNKTYKAMDSGYPTYGTDQKVTFKSTFTGSDANFDWNEFTVANGNSDSSKNLNRKVSAEGTKASGQIWELTLEISVA